MEKIIREVNYEHSFSYSYSFSFFEEKMFFTCRKCKKVLGPSFPLLVKKTNFHSLNGIFWHPLGIINP